MLILRITIVFITFLALYFILSIYQKTQLQEQKAREKAQKEERIKELTLKIKEYEGEIYNSVFEYESILNSGRYVSKIEYPRWLDKWGYLHPIIDEYTESELVLENDSDINSLKTIFRNGDVKINNQNDRFIQSELTKNREFFDNIEDFPLTDNQRTTIIVDEKNNLVVAGAGTGKTSTIVGKAGYLLKNEYIQPYELLLISFARKARDEMYERGLEKIKLGLNVHTFHSLGLNIIGQVEGKRPSLSELSTDKNKLTHAIIAYIQRRSNKRGFINKLNRYFAFHHTPYVSEYEFNKKGDYIDYLKTFELRSLKGDLVKSFEELEIANFLYINGIEYVYEQEYEITTADKQHRQYKPDFYIPQKGIYIEHFGIDKENQTAPFVDREQYLADMEWKRETHKENKTTLLETYSWQKTEGTLLENLAEELLNHEIAFNPISPDKLYNEINQLGLVHPFTSLAATFLNLYKSSGYSLTELYERVKTLDNPTRYKAFLDIFKEILEEYQQDLGDQIDFNDMIIKAENYLKTGEYQSPYKYVLVDEFQDISYSRYSLLKSLLQNNREAKSFCVGDDWQSIYRFTGSDISIMSKFDDHFKPSEILSLDKTFRFNNMLCDLSTKFILENPNQIKKTLTTHTESNEPALTLHWTENETQEIDQILETIPRNQTSVFILGRYNHQEPPNLIDLRRKYPELDIKYYTIHSSKGKQADYVIVLGLTSEKYSFPSQIEDDPILNVVLSEKETIPNAEERRLFYVAITRAKKHVHLIADPNTPSSFATELEKGNFKIEVVGTSPRAGVNCPQCRTGIIVSKWSQNGRFYACNNFPYCEFIPRWCPQCGRGFLHVIGSDYVCSDEACSFRKPKCPSCKDGYLVERFGRTKFLGCVNYPNCRYTLSLTGPRKSDSRRRY